MSVSDPPAVGETVRPRTIDMPLEKLPPIDEHAIELAAPAEAAWEALFPVLEQTLDNHRARRYAIRVDAAVTVARGDLHHPGGMLPGFTVLRAIEPVMLALAGRHRYAQYAMVFRIDLLPGQRSRVRLESRAQFLGRKGRLYRAGVVGTRGHVLFVNRMLRAVRRGAEQSPDER